ncbi:MipA/OmpV family protein [Belnapia rosea]|uniref:MipA/OmpV family protein n=1 Tax=Belnapia rosea TaxID=938405 RepID=UPI00087E7813|nr:MipA/OmpV family protein [Belnapia rosea]SDB63790.1 Outer membrane scaffolding protein for murein synthesis, MipA/OmpV family [Belnapia rosea]
MRAALGLLPLLLATGAAAQEVRRPLLELGVFGGGALLPDYPAAGQSHWRALALPWVIYRGELLKSDERGMRGRVYRDRDLELTINFNGALGTDSRDNRARQGMPDLDYLGEVGPSLRWVAWRDSARATRLTLEAPVRAVFSTDFSSTHFRGFVLAPEMAVERSGLGRPEARLRAGIGPVFASGRLMDYWYRVGGSDVRPGRPAYDATGGYLGLRFQFSYRLPVTERISLTAGGRLENFSGATNAGSPLFRQEFNATVVGGLSFALYRTEAMVASAAEPFD